MPPMWIARSSRKRTSACARAGHGCQNPERARLCQKIKGPTKWCWFDVPSFGLWVVRPTRVEQHPSVIDDRHDCASGDCDGLFRAEHIAHALLTRVCVLPVLELRRPLRLPQAFLVPIHVEFSPEYADNEVDGMPELVLVVILSKKP
eukprot:1543142-Rhodomonas_salina.1